MKLVGSFAEKRPFFRVKSLIVKVSSFEQVSFAQKIWLEAYALNSAGAKSAERTNFVP
jgi:hypothetical protein